MLTQAARVLRGQKWEAPLNPAGRCPQAGNTNPMNTHLSARGTVADCHYCHCHVILETRLA